MTVSGPMVGHLSMLAFSALVSLSFTFGSWVAGEIDPGVLTGVRFVIAVTVLSAIAMVRGDAVRRVFGKAGRWIVIGGLMALYFITMFEALRLTTPLATAAVFTLTPLMATGFGWMLIGATANRVMMAALVLGGIGALWVIFDADLARFLAFDIGPGERLFFIGALAHAAVPALTRRLAPVATSFEAALGTTVGAFLVTAVYAAPEALRTDFTTLRPLVWMVALYLGAVTTAGTFFLLQTAVARIAPGKVMAYTYLVPSWVVLHGLLQGQSERSLIYIGVAITLISLAILLVQDIERK